MVLLGAEAAGAQRVMCDCTHCAQLFRREKVCVHSKEAAVVVGAERMVRDYHICTGRNRPRPRLACSVEEAQRLEAEAEVEEEASISKAVTVGVGEQKAAWETSK